MTKKLPNRIHYSLGFDPTTKKHKVLRAEQPFGFDQTPHWSIFTLGIDKSWREIHFYTKFYPRKTNCVHIDGVIYSVNFYGYFPHDDIAAEENFRMISFPLGVKVSPTTIVDIKGELALLNFKNFHDANIIVYILTNGGRIKYQSLYWYHQSLWWTNLYPINLPPHIKGRLHWFHLSDSIRVGWTHSCSSMIQQRRKNG